MAAVLLLAAAAAADLGTMEAGAATYLNHFFRCATKLAFIYALNALVGALFIGAFYEGCFVIVDLLI